MNDFELMTNEQVAEILNTAMDNGEWHTPSTDYRSIELNELSSKVVRYGTCKEHLQSERVDSAHRRIYINPHS